MGRRTPTRSRKCPGGSACSGRAWQPDAHSTLQYMHTRSHADSPSTAQHMSATCPQTKSRNQHFLSFPWHNAVLNHLILSPSRHTFHGIPAQLCAQIYVVMSVCWEGVTGRNLADRSAAACKLVAHVVQERLQLIWVEAILVKQHVVVRRPALAIRLVITEGTPQPAFRTRVSRTAVAGSPVGAEQASVAVQIEVVALCAGDFAVDHL